MKVYRIRCADNYLDLTLDKSTDSEHPIETNFTGESKLLFWTPPLMFTNKKRRRRVTFLVT